MALRARGLHGGLKILVHTRPRTGNVPFGDYKVYDPKYNKFNFRIHDYFIAKALDQVRTGGVVAVVTTKGTLDKSNPTIRKYLAERAELVGAIRLPNTAFKGNAGTEVTSDILFLQKRERKIDIEPDWVHLGYTENGIAVNSYFAEHPEMILGRMEYDTGQFGADSRYTVCVNDNPDFNLYEAINNAVGNIQAQITDFERLTDEEEKAEVTIPAEELSEVRLQLKEIKEDTLINNIKKTLSEAADRLENRCNEIKMQLFEVKESMKTKAHEIVNDFKKKGKSALNKVSEFFGVKEKLQKMRDSVKEGIAEN